MSKAHLPVVIPIDRFNSIAHINPPVRLDGGLTDAENKHAQSLWTVPLRNSDDEMWHVVVVLTTDADVRAYVPDLITAVAGLPENDRPFKEPVALWDDHYKWYTLVDRFFAQGIGVCRFLHGSVVGKTREECLLTGLIAALKAAKV